jgi:hypothetical protein
MPQPVFLDLSQPVNETSSQQEGVNMNLASTHVLVAALRGLGAIYCLDRGVNALASNDARIGDLSPGDPREGRIVDPADLGDPLPRTFALEGFEAGYNVN